MLESEQWGSVARVQLTRAQDAMLYTGWGDTIGHGSGAALYAFSINKAVESPG